METEADAVVGQTASSSYKPAVWKMASVLWYPRILKPEHVFVRPEDASYVERQS